MANTAETQTVIVLQREVPYEGATVLGIFTTEEAAEAFLVLFKEDHYVSVVDTYALMRAPINPEGGNLNWEHIRNIY